MIANKKRRIVLIAHNVRSSHNIGAMFRTAEGLGVEEFIMSGYSPYPLMDNDQRMPHEAAKTNRAIHKTALGAETTLKWQHIDDLVVYTNMLRDNNYHIYAVEQNAQSVLLHDFKPPEKIALIVGNELSGIDDALLATMDGTIEIPMLGKKESYNVSAAATMALYHCKFAL